MILPLLSHCYEEEKVLYSFYQNSLLQTKHLSNVLVSRQRQLSQGYLHFPPLFPVLTSATNIRLSSCMPLQAEQSSRVTPFCGTIKAAHSSLKCLAKVIKQVIGKYGNMTQIFYSLIDILPTSPQCPSITFYSYYLLYHLWDHSYLADKKNQDQSKYTLIWLEREK